MELGQILIAQFTTLLSLFTVLLSIDSQYITSLCTSLYSSPYLSVSDDKGLFLFLFITYLISSISILEIIRNLSGKNYKLKDKVVYIQTCNYNNSFLLFANFLSLYIYKKLCARTVNLLMIGMFNCAFYNLTYLMELKYVSGLVYCNFIVANILSFMCTYVQGFGKVLDLTILQYKRYKLY
ncbi:uncharacterized protein VNE69_06134 [Vairimorpha necatrix]|uniref:Membrane protein n=1 Tax=Vairimorpha necatrix TaxID=6039 RepID=A0AAX4JCT6_9MICR